MQTTSWQNRLDAWLAPFLDALGDKRRRKWAPLCILGLLLPGDRKSIQPISGRVAPKDEEQVHHFVATSCWDTAPVEDVLCAREARVREGTSKFTDWDEAKAQIRATVR